jgi:hypothetical protein
MRITRFNDRIDYLCVLLGDAIRKYREIAYGFHSYMNPKILKDAEADVESIIKELRTLCSGYRHWDKK